MSHMQVIFLLRKILRKFHVEEAYSVRLYIALKLFNTIPLPSEEVEIGGLPWQWSMVNFGIKYEPLYSLEILMTKLKGRGAEVHEDSLPRGEFDRQSARRGGKQPRWQDGCEDSTGVIDWPDKLDGSWCSWSKSKDWSVLFAAMISMLPELFLTQDTNYQSNSFSLMY